MRYRFTKTHTQGILTDVFDGAAYQTKVCHLDENYITLSINFDGAPRFKSSGMQVWPVQILINELPPKMRLTHALKKNSLIIRMKILCEHYTGSIYTWPFTYNYYNTCMVIISLYYNYYRFAAENLLLAGLWCGKQKPPTFSFFEPLLVRLKRLFCDGQLAKCQSFIIYI